MYEPKQESFVLRNVKRVSGEAIDVVIEEGKITEVTTAGSGQGNK